MRWQRLTYRAGCWAFILTGAGHLATQWLAPRTAEQEAILDAMRRFPIKMPGSDGNLYQFHTGFSIMMGVLLAAYGAQALLTAYRQPVPAESDVRLLALHTLVAALAVILSAMFFFAVPVAFMAIAFMAFGLGLILARRTPLSSGGQ